jgi:hypothetical protein
MVTTLMKVVFVQTWSFLRVVLTVMQCISCRQHPTLHVTLVALQALLMLLLVVAVVAVAAARREQEHRKAVVVL